MNIGDIVATYFLYPGKAKTGNDDDAVVLEFGMWVSVQLSLETFPIYLSIILQYLIKYQNRHSTGVGVGGLQQVMLGILIWVRQVNLA
mgnify:CR=1 FL=1